MATFHWTPERLKFLGDNVRVLSDRQMAEALTRLTGIQVTTWAVNTARRKFLRVSKRPGNGEVLPDPPGRGRKP